MSNKPIFVATHPRACSTAFERVFLTYRNTLSCVHEPFGDAWYFGPERLSNRFATEESRKKSGFSETTYRDIFDSIDGQAKGKRLFIKDMAQYWIPLQGESTIAPSLVHYRRGVGTDDSSAASESSAASSDGEEGSSNNNDGNDAENNDNTGSNKQERGNPTVIPDSLLRQFHFTFLIRHPRSSVPSYFRCTIPPLSTMTGFDYFDPVESGYKELRMLFEYLVSEGHIGPKLAGSGNHVHSNHFHHSGTGADDVMKGDNIDICVVDADDMLDNPSGIIEAYCKSTGLEYEPGCLRWDAESQKHAKDAFEKWKGFHEDALDSSELRPRTHKKAIPTDEELVKTWTEKYGETAARIMIKTVKENEADYEYLKQFALKV